ncbi:SDR family oxidoreductase [Camelimonas abortus]|uniref:SDR family oxidoreductase n=1 Tax=Camelimonas abortus TaxID=1017184 RepID=A0ABV7LGN4_9HYPH
MDLGIAGRKAIVSASSRGLGRACAMALAEAGCDVIINGRDAQAVAETVSAINARGRGKARGVAADLSTQGGREQVARACPDADILVNNNGGPPPADYTALGHDDILRGLEQNMVAPIQLIQALAPGMAQRGFGRIVNITSASVLTPLPGLDLSSGARAGLTAFVSGVARQLAPHGVTVNNILPGAFATDRLAAILKNAAAASGQSEEQVARARAAAIPARRFGDPDEFGKLCAFICSAHAGYITGHNFLIDGGAFPANF